MKIILKLGLTAALLLTISGCTSLGLGESEYGCKGMPDGVQCMSSREVYMATNNGNKIYAPLSEGGGNKDSKNKETNKTTLNRTEKNFVSDTYLTPSIPDSPVPIRTPAQVMRIWIGQWEDSNRDLIGASEIYTEIEARKWVIAQPYESSNKYKLKSIQNEYTTPEQPKSTTTK